MFYLIPNFLDPSSTKEALFPSNLASILDTLEGIICENEKNARHFLRQFIPMDRVRSLRFYAINEHSKDQEIIELFDTIKNHQMGILTDAGLPCIADPGSKIVYLAHKHHIPVKAIPGPTSIMMALQLSGFYAQRFSFHGYLSNKEEELKNQLIGLEREANSFQKVQIWIETPYRTNWMVQKVLAQLKDETLFCVCQNLTGKEERVVSMPVKEWKKQQIHFSEGPSVFILASAKLIIQ
jgi:16S rRNA (cytidine1402-2'-O)-methyltransferase